MQYRGASDYGDGAVSALVFAAFIAVVGCGKAKPGEASNASPHSPKVTHETPVASGTLSDLAPRPAPSGSGSGSAAIESLEDPRQLLKEWTRALNAADLGALGRLYAERVRFYGISLARDEVIEKKRKALQATPTFAQEVTGKPRVEPKGDVIRVVFQKRSGPKGQQRDVLGTLVLRKAPPFSIVEETDAVTEKRYGRVRAAADAPKDCPAAVWFLVDSTPEAKRLFDKIEKNLKAFPPNAGMNPGGMGPIMPNETGDGTYEYSIGVHHPDRFESYGWFTVDATGKVTVSSWNLELDDVETSPSKEALAEFQKHCGTDHPR